MGKANFSRYSYLLIILLIAPVVVWTAHASSGTAEVTVGGDAFVTYFTPTTNFNGDGLLYEIARLPTDDGNGNIVYCFHNTGTSYLKFDLSGVDFSIEKAQIELHVNSGQDGDILWLMAADEGWSESAITWNSAPPPGPFIFVQAIEVNGLLIWRDDGSQPFQLADWLAANQAMNGGDDMAAVTILGPLPAGCTVDPSDERRTLTFDDRESGQQPMLALADATNSLPDIPPAAVTLSEAPAVTPPRAVPFVLWLLLAALTLAALRRRTTA